MADKLKIKEKVKVWDVLNRFFRQEFPARCGNYKSPFREDHMPSFSIFAGGDMFKDHADGVSGDIFTLLTHYGNKNFRQAASLLADWTKVLDIPVDRPMKQQKEEKPLSPPPEGYGKLSSDIRTRGRNWRDDDNVLITLCKRKRWPMLFMNNLINRGVVGLNKDGSAAWVMSRGIKLRHDAFASHSDRWMCGKAQENMFLDGIFNHGSSVVFICEGETDSITALFSGITKGGKCSVLGVAGASILPHKKLLKPLVSGKMVVLVGDNDAAGRQFVRRMTEHLFSLGVMARHMNWHGIDHNDLGDFWIAEGPDAVKSFLEDSTRWQIWKKS